jgi:hypothetical protein
VSLKELVSCLNRNLLGQFLREICPFKKMTPFLCRIYAALAGVLLIETKSLVELVHLGNILWGYTWVAGRFSKRHMRCIREEDNKSNKQVTDKLLIQMSLLVLY